VTDVPATQNAILSIEINSVQCPVCDHTLHDAIGLVEDIDASFSVELENRFQKCAACGALLELGAVFRVEYPGAAE